MTAGAYPGFRSMKRLGVLLLHLSAFRQVSLTIFWYPFILLGEERHCMSKVSCPTTQRNDPARARTRTSRAGVQRANH